MSGISKTCFGFSLPLSKAENCLAEHQRKSSILTMFQASQLDQNGCAIFLDIDTSYISDSGPEYENSLNGSAWKPKILKKLGISNISLLRRVGICWDHTKISQIEKNQHLLYKSIFHYQLILQKPSKWIILFVSLPNSQYNVYHFIILKKQLTIENTFAKQMLIFFNLWYFGMISANSNPSQQRIVVYPHFFQNFGLSSWAIQRVFILRTWIRYIWCIYVQKICTTILVKLRGLEHGQNAWFSLALS